MSGSSERTHELGLVLQKMALDFSGGKMLQEQIDDWSADYRGLGDGVGSSSGLVFRADSSTTLKRNRVPRARRVLRGVELLAAPVEVRARAEDGRVRSVQLAVSTGFHLFYSASRVVSSLRFGRWRVLLKSPRIARVRLNALDRHSPDTSL